MGALLSRMLFGAAPGRPSAPSPATPAPPAGGGDAPLPHGERSSAVEMLDAAVEEIRSGRAKRDSAVVRQLLAEAERALSHRTGRSSMRTSISAPSLGAVGEASAINVLDAAHRLAVLHSMYALAQVIDETGMMPEHLVPLFEKAVCALVGSTSATLYEYDNARAELHHEARADQLADVERVSTVIMLGEGEVGEVGLRASQGQPNVSAYWSPVPGAHALAVPMRTRGGRGRLVGVAVAVRAPAGAGGEEDEGEAAPFGAYDEAMLRALADGAAALVLQTIAHRETTVLRYHAELLVALHAADPNRGGLDEAIMQVIAILIKMLSAEKVSLFIADEVRQEFWVRTSETSTMGGAAGVSFKFGAGIVGHVYTTKRALNLPDAYRCEHFSPAFDRETGYRTRQVLCVPMLDAAGRVIAVVQALNKHGGCDVFTTQDERTLALCCEKIARTMVAKLGRATFRELLYDKRAHTQAFRIISGSEEGVRMPAMAAAGGGGGGATRRRLGGGAVHGALGSAEVMRSLLSDLPQLSLGIETWALAKDDLTLRVMLMLREMNLAAVLGMAEEALLHFLHDVQSEYLDACPYHNYQHAFTVTLICFHLLKDSRTHRDVLRPLDTLALLLSAICHDVAHPGLNNGFLVNSAAELALVYNDQSVLEHHHAATMFRLLRALGKEAGGAHDLLGKLSVSDASEFRRMCIQMILGTDMTKHFAQVDTLHSIAAKLQTRRDAVGARARAGLDAGSTRASVTPPLPGGDGGDGGTASPPAEADDVGQALSEAKQQLLESILHCADIGNPTLPFEGARYWAIRVVDEFKLQTALEQAKGLPTPPSMLQTLGDSTDCTAIGMQVQFISYFVQPIWSALEKVLPEISAYNEAIAANLAQFKELHARLLEEKAASARAVDRMAAAAPASAVRMPIPVASSTRGTTASVTSASATDSHR